MKDPIVIDPPDFNIEQAWKGCETHFNKMSEAGRPEAAAAGADPGCCSCPACRSYFWNWGKKIRCSDCGFEFPNDAWPMFSWGAQAATRKGAANEERMKHPYYKYGFEHPDKDFHKIDWRNIL